MHPLTGRLIFLTYRLSHEPGGLGIIIYPFEREVYASLNLTYILYHNFLKKSKKIFYGERGGLYPGCPAIRSPLYNSVFGQVDRKPGTVCCYTKGPSRAPRHSLNDGYFKILHPVLFRV